MHDLAAGIYKYKPFGHRLIRRGSTDKRRELARAAMDQDWMQEGAVLLVFSAVEKRTTRKYGRRGVGYVYIEVGHAAQNVFLQAQSLGLDAAVVGAFDDDRVQRIVTMVENERPLYLMPVGRPR